MAKADGKISIAFKLEGTPKDDGLVRFADFATFVDGAFGTLRALERSETGSRSARIEYRVTRLEVSSAAITIETVDVPELRIAGERIAARLVEGLVAVRDGLIGMSHFEPSVREGFTKMLAPLRRGVRSVTAEVGEVSIAIVGQPKALGLQQVEYETAALGSFYGSVDALNVHGDPFFYLYPPVGPTKIKCVFDTSMLEDVRAAVKRYTKVEGLIEYFESSPFPARIIVERLTPFSREDGLPSLSQLWGIAPGLTGDVDEVQYIRRLRDAE